MPKRAIPAYHEPELRKLAAQYQTAMEANDMTTATGLAFQLAGYVESLFDDARQSPTPRTSKGAAASAVEPSSEKTS